MKSILQDFTMIKYMNTVVFSFHLHFCYTPQPWNDKTYRETVKIQQAKAFWLKHAEHSFHP